MAISIIKGDIFSAVAETMETDPDAVAMFDNDESEEHLIAYG